MRALIRSSLRVQRWLSRRALTAGQVTAQSGRPDIVEHYRFAEKIHAVGRVGCLGSLACLACVAGGATVAAPGTFRVIATV
jgi:hypothetical protein